MKNVVQADGTPAQAFGKDGTDFPTHHHLLYCMPKNSGISDVTTRTWVKGSTDTCGCRQVDADGNTYYQKRATAHQTLQIMTSIDSTTRRTVPHPFPNADGTPKEHPVIFPDMNRYAIVTDTAVNGSTSTRMEYTSPEGGYAVDEKNILTREWVNETTKLDTDGTSSSTTGR